MAFSMDESTAESVTASAPEAGGSADAKVKEDSFETNNQVSTTYVDALYYYIFH